MTRLGRICLVVAALCALDSVIGGAWAAHIAGNPLARRLMHTAAGYEMSHALAVFACALVAHLGGRRAWLAAVLFLLGVALFSGSLYLIALGAPPAIGAVTPVGGLAFIAGWLALAWSCVGLKPASLPQATGNA